MKISIAINSLFSIFFGLGYINKNFKVFWKEFILLFLISFITYIFTAFIIFTLSNWLLSILFTTILPDIAKDFELLKNTISFLISIISSAYIFSSLSIILNSPIYDSIAQKVLFEYTKRQIVKTDIMSEILNTLLFETKKFLLLILILTVTFLLNLIPCIGTIVFFVINLFTFIIFTGLDLYNPCLSRIDNKLLTHIKYIIKNPIKTWPNILFSGFLCAIPVINIFLIPISVTGSIINFYKREL